MEEDYDAYERLDEELCPECGEPVYMHAENCLASAASVCPACGAPALMHIEGCCSCPCCGYSRCG